VVGFSHEQIGVAVAKYLVGLKKYKHYAIVSATDHRALIRQRSFVKSLAKHGIQDVWISHVPAPTSFKLGREGVATLLDQGFSEGAIFFSSDTLAHGAMAEAQSRGITVPEQLAYIGFGDQPYAAYTIPALTTVRFNLGEIGSLAAESLLARIDNTPLNQKVIDLGFKIIERGTT